MRIKVKLFGTLGRQRPGYEPDQGLWLDFPDGATVEELLARLEIQAPKGGVVAADGRVLQVREKLWDGALVHVLQPVFGG
ncbi:MAG: MoaD/ThiS family protein [Thermodesulfobacteriota bacterium]